MAEHGEGNDLRVGIRQIGAAADEITRINNFPIDDVESHWEAHPERRSQRETELARIRSHVRARAVDVYFRARNRLRTLRLVNRSRDVPRRLCSCGRHTTPQQAEPAGKPDAPQPRIRAVDTRSELWRSGSQQRVVVQGRLAGGCG